MIASVVFRVRSFRIVAGSRDRQLRPGGVVDRRLLLLLRRRSSVRVGPIEPRRKRVMRGRRQRRLEPRHRLDFELAVEPGADLVDGEVVAASALQVAGGGGCAVVHFEASERGGMNLETKVKNLQNVSLE